VIEVQSLSKRFGRFAALDCISFNVARGETFALLGPNGSGKTTALKCLAGLTIPSRGEIRINGNDLPRHPDAAKNHISYLPQHVAFPEHVNAREVLDLYRRLRRVPATRIDAVLDACALSDSAQRLVGEFSGGMRQRLGIAVALLADAPILLLDEPTASLDPEAAVGFRALLASLKHQGKTILFSSHVLSDVDLLADRLAILVAGRVRVIESVGALRDELDALAVLHVQLANTNKRFCSVASSAGATSVHLSAKGLTIVARAQDRASILRALECCGAEVLSFSTVEPSLEDIYLRCIHESPNDRSAACARELREPLAATG
jgi:ABC-type multidrug transport system ATPase subunit